MMPNDLEISSITEQIYGLADKLKRYVFKEVIMSKKTINTAIYEDISDDEKSIIDSWRI